MTVENTKSGSVVDQTAKPRVRVGKSHQDYWASRLVKRSYATRDGQTAISPDWSCRIGHLGRREFFNLGTPNRAAATAKARDVYLSLISSGWEATLQKFKPDMIFAKDGCTVGEFIDEARAVSGLKPVTFEIYARKFRTLVAGVFHIDCGKAKHDYKNGGYKAWLNRVHACRLDRLTPEKVNEWKVQELKAAKSPLALKHANVTLRSVLLSSKALFSANIRKHLRLRLPSPLPFDGVTLPEIGKSRYKSEINPAILLQQAKRELAEGWKGEGQALNPRPELFKIVLLALGAGLRRDEIDKLQWQQIKWDKSIIRVETTEHGGTKSTDSEADIDVDPGLLEILEDYMPKPGKGSPFIIQSPIEPRANAVSYHHYRCDRQFKELILWLREKGIRARNALHALRKEFGSQICAQAGIYAASVALRHSTITITRDYYLDKKQPVVLEIAKLLDPLHKAALK